MFPFTAPFYPLDLYVDPSTNNYAVPGLGNGGGSAGNVDGLALSFWETENSSDLSSYFKSIDYHPEDGWELLSKNFNTDVNSISGIESAHFILYNRYAGVIRPFFFIKSSSQSESNTIQIDMELRENKDATALMAHATPIMKSVQEFVSDHSHAFVENIATTTRGFWAYADFPVAYDPCTCHADAVLSFKVTMIDNAAITLTGTMISDKTVASDASQDGERSVGYTSSNKNLETAFSKLNKGYKTLSSADIVFGDMNERASNNMDDNTRELLSDVSSSTSSSPDALGELLNLAVGFSSVASGVGVLLNFFTGNWQKEASKEKTYINMDMDLGVDLQGSFLSVVSTDEIIIRLPGSNTSQTGMPAPLYDNTLGVFNLMETPHFDAAVYKPTQNYFSNNFDDLRYYYDFMHINIPSLSGAYSRHVDSSLHLRNFLEFKLNRPLLYAINPSANVKPRKILANIQFRIKDDKSTHISTPLY